jgi:uncharacterized protein
MGSFFVDFEWDQNKAVININKHDVSFPDAATVFDDALSVTFPDSDHSIGESRYVIIGTSVSGLLLVVAHTDRDNCIRIISARRATRQEKRFYEEDN